MTIKKYQYTGCLFLTIMLCGCQQINQTKASYLELFEDDYRVSELLPPLKIPEDLSYPTSTESYPFPENLEPGPLPCVSLVPPGFGELSSS